MQGARYIPSLGSEVLLTLVVADLHNDAASKTIEVSLSAAKVRCRPNLVSHHVLGFFKLITSVSQIALALYSRRFVPVKYTIRKSGHFVIFNGLRPSQPAPAAVVDLNWT